MSLRVKELQFLDWKPITMEVAAGEAICVRGGSGSGKSLLLRAIADLIPHEGEAFLNGRARSAFAASDWRLRVGYLPAEVLWWEDRVGDHFLGPVDAKRLEALGLAGDCFDWHPHRLSMGERQRLGLLRLFDRKPEVLLLDEPTSNLDDASAKLVETMIFEYAAEHRAPLIWITHSLAQAERIGPRRYRMEDKQLNEEVAT